MVKFPIAFLLALQETTLATMMKTASATLTGKLWTDRSIEAVAEMTATTRLDLLEHLVGGYKVKKKRASPF